MSNEKIKVCGAQGFEGLYPKVEFRCPEDWDPKDMIQLGDELAGAIFNMAAGDFARAVTNGLLERFKVKGPRLPIFRPTRKRRKPKDPEVPDGLSPAKRKILRMRKGKRIIRIGGKK